MTGNSAYVQVNSYLLLEYQYASEVIYLNGSGSAKALRIANQYDDTYGFINNSQALKVTGNVLTNSACAINSASGKWGYLDQNIPSPIDQTNANLTITDRTSSLGSLIKYDTIKVHMLSGFTFPGVAGFIAQVKFKEFLGNDFNAAVHVFLHGQDQVKLAPTPLFLGDRLYDRYVEFKVPSLAEINADYWPNPTATNTVGYQYTHGGAGFSQTAPITFTFSEINDKVIEKNQPYLLTGQTWDVTLNASEMFAPLGAVVQESPDYDYIEYYPTFGGQFLEDFITSLNTSGGSWVVINQIEVYEQVGISRFRTANMTMLQESEFDRPGLFRPVIHNAFVAFSYTVEYTMRLYDRSTGQEIIRRSSFTSYEPKKYGKELDKIEVTNGFRPFKVYNKVVSSNPESVAATIPFNNPQIIAQKVYIPTFFDLNLVSVDSTSDVSIQLGDTVYAQGENVIFLTQFENYVKFKVFTKSADKKQNVSFDFSTSYANLRLVFFRDDDTKVIVEPLMDASLANPGNGEVVFRVIGATSTSLLHQARQDYYIVMAKDNGEETLLYSGKFADARDRADVTASNLNKIQAGLQDKINALDAAKAALTTAQTESKAKTTTTKVTTKTPSSSTKTLDDHAKHQANVLSQQTETVTKSQQALKDAINNAANNDAVHDLNLSEPPGFAINIATNIKSGMIPLVLTPSKPSTSTGKDNQDLANFIKNKGG